MTETIFLFINESIDAGGYPIVFILTLIDSTVFPLPNEAFMPFIGALIASGRFSFWWILFISILGAVLGSLTSYFLGYYGADPFLKKFGKYLRIKQENLEKTHQFFEKYGERIILISRFIPVVRQFISLPAGAAKMNLVKFCFYTAIGSGIWNATILALGYFVGANSEKFKIYTSWIDKILLLSVILAAGFFLLKKKNIKK
jgi:membrane protein DedA with SNARE-associated domain